MALRARSRCLPGQPGGTSPCRRSAPTDGCSAPLRRSPSQHTDRLSSTSARASGRLALRRSSSLLAVTDTVPGTSPLEYDRDDARRQPNQCGECGDRKAGSKHDRHNRDESSEAHVHAREATAATRPQAARTQLRHVPRRHVGAHCRIRRKRGRGRFLMTSISQRRAPGTQIVCEPPSRPSLTARATSSGVLANGAGARS